jgi:hypothetical protein
MKLIAGYKYLKTSKGLIVPWSETLEKTADFEVYIPSETIVTGNQCEENDKLRPAPEKVKTSLKAQKKEEPPVKQEEPRIAPQQTKVEMDLTGDELQE